MSSFLSISLVLCVLHASKFRYNSHTPRQVAWEIFDDIVKREGASLGRGGGERKGGWKRTESKWSFSTHIANLTLSVDTVSDAVTCPLKGRTLWRMEAGPDQCGQPQATLPIVWGCQGQQAMVSLRSGRFLQKVRETGIICSVCGSGEQAESCLSSHRHDWFRMYSSVLFVFYHFPRVSV